MMVVFVSQCEKNALAKTRRVLDAFADRIGDNTWQTVITDEGLQAVRKLLRKTASKSTAVSCHWIRSRSRSDLLWIVGNRRKFNEQGIVPVNYTEGDIDQFMDKEKWQSLEVIKCLSAIAGFFHDLGKASFLFQQKLNPQKSKSIKTYEPYRHEWVSLRLFQAFVGGQADREWLKSLANVNNETEQYVLSSLERLKDGLVDNPKQAECTLPPLAKCIAWLIVSHHKLPFYPEQGDNPPNFENVENWFEANLESSWNSPQCLSNDWVIEDKQNNWCFPVSTPFMSSLWQARVRVFAKRFLSYEEAFSSNWFDQHFTLHLSRLCMMLSDHHYSSGVKISEADQDPNYHAYANTCKNEFNQVCYKQKLDEHNIQVGINAYAIAEGLPKLLRELPFLGAVPALIKKVHEEYRNDYGWQDDAYALAKSLRQDVQNKGFFGVSMASTGKGKTRGNMRIMYGLSEKPRISVAMGLRTLTLQTGDVFKEDIGLDGDELAVLIGSSAIKELHEQSKLGQNKISEQKESELGGSLSSESLLQDELVLVEQMPEYYGDFKKWIEHDPKIVKLIQAPVLVSTIDYLMPATEGVRGGQQIAPMLRLLSSDVILDEPDDFGLDDLPALCRLVNWVGMLGGRILLSTATLSPTLAKALFAAYQAGRNHYVKANSTKGIENAIVCAWFDEFTKNKPKSENISSISEYEKAHADFVKKRINNLQEENLVLRKGKIIPISKNNQLPPSKLFANSVFQSIAELHRSHAITIEDKKVSLGLVRMANINPLVQVAKYLFNTESSKDTIIHYCVYHSQFPLAQRSFIEKQLDNFLSRHNGKEWLEKSKIKEIISKHKQTNHVFVVLATAVAEVGRDHDYDWAVVEPSSMRSIIQLAGRVQRHRKEVPTVENIHVFSKNLKALKGKVPSYEKPGFESKKLRYFSRDLEQINIENIDASIRIKIPKITKDILIKAADYTEVKSFELLESLAQSLILDSNTNNLGAAIWWNEPVTWNAEIQKLQKFRKGRPNENYRLHQTRRGDYIWQKEIMGSSPRNYENTSNIIADNWQHLAQGAEVWGKYEYKAEFEHFAQLLKIDEEQALHRYSHITLDMVDKDNVEPWLYHPYLGIYKKLKNDRYEDE
ncbi:MAG: type I-F CRISPR-associated helicase Cas3f [Desulfomicrobium sp.]|nr:type I-F CRISPR-associated helicase Cas3f [Desulfomicrobium sp.]